MNDKIMEMLIKAYEEKETIEDIYLQILKENTQNIVEKTWQQFIYEWKVNYDVSTDLIVKYEFVCPNKLVEFTKDTCLDYSEKEKNNAIKLNINSHKNDVIFIRIGTNMVPISLNLFRLELSVDKINLFVSLKDNTISLSINKEKIDELIKTNTRRLKK